MLKSAGFRFVCEYTDIANKIVLGSTMCRNDDTSLKTIKKWHSFAEKGKLEDLVAQSIDDIYSENTLKDYRDVLIQANSELSDEDIERYLIMTESILDFGSSEELKMVTCPVLVLGCKGDRVIGPDASREIAEHTGAELYMYEDISGHYVGINAFYRCLQLSDLTIPKVRQIETGAFSATNLSGSGTQDIVIPEGCEYVGKLAFDSVGVYAAENGITYKIPASVRTLGHLCFRPYQAAAFEVAADNPNFASENGILFNKDKTEIKFFPARNGMTDFTIPDGVVKLDEASFLDTQFLKTITIPASVTKLDSAFAGMWSLEKYIVAADNPSYKDVDGVLYSKDGKMLVSYPYERYAEEYVIPEGTESLAYEAFGDAQVSAAGEGCDSRQRDHHHGLCVP